jgi:hypothetical protein
MVNKKPANRLSKSAATINTKKVVVKKDMIDFIKTQGMARALKRAGEIKASGKGGEREFLEGVRRMYGQSRLDAATKSAGPKMSTMSVPKGANKKSANRLSKSTATIKTKVGSKPAPKPTTKKSKTTDPVAKFIFGVGRAAAEPFKSKPKK